jgi:hypothetical protein
MQNQLQDFILSSHVNGRELSNFQEKNFSRGLQRE